MDLDSSMKRAIRSGDLVELERLLTQATASMLTVELAISRLAEKPRSAKRKETVNLLLMHGWDVNSPLGADKDPMLR